MEQGWIQFLLVVVPVMSLIGSWLVYQIGYGNENGGFEIIPFIAGIVVAAILIAIYSNVTGRKTTIS